MIPRTIPTSLARALCVAALLIAGLSCSSPTEADRHADVDLPLLLHWPDGADPLTATRLSATSLYVELRDEDETLATSTTTSITPTDDPVPFTISVPMDSARQSFILRVRLSAGSTLLFAATELVVLPDAALHPRELLLDYAGPGSDAVQIALAPSQARIAANATLALTAELRNPGSEVVGTPVHWTVNDATLGTITQAGVFTGLGIPGEVTVTALAATGHSAQASLSLREAVDELEVVGGDAQASVPVQAFAAPLAVRALRSGEPVPDADVAWSVALGSATVAAVTSTGTDGIASVIVTAGEAAGGVVIRAAVDGLETFFQLDVTAGPPALLTPVVTSSTALNFASRAIRRPVHLRLTDLQGNAVAGVPVQYTVTSGGGSVPTPGPRISAVDGLVPIDWVLGPTFGDQTLNAATPCTPTGGCVSFDLTVPARLYGFITREISGGAGQVGAQGSAFAEPVRFRITDQGVGIANVPVRIHMIRGAASFGESLRYTDAQGEVALTVTPLTPGPLRIAFGVTEEGSDFGLAADLEATPVGYTHTWLGVTADWNTASNWSTGTVPTAADSVVVPDGTPMAPALSAATAVASLYHTDPRPLSLEGRVLTVHGNLLSTSSIRGAGRVDMTGTDRFLSGQLDTLRVLGTVRNTADAGSLARLELEAGAELDLGATYLIVTDSAIFRGGFPRMNHEYATLRTLHAKFESGTMPDDMMTHGNLVVVGDLLVPGSLRTFGDHVVTMAYLGTGEMVRRRIEVANAGEEATRIQTFRVDVASALLETDLYVPGSFYVRGLFDVASGAHLEIGGLLRIVPGSIMHVAGTIAFESCERGHPTASVITGFSCP